MRLPNLSPLELVLADDGPKWGVGSLLAPIRRAPWWQWVLLSVGMSLAATSVAVGSLVALAFRGFDLLEYVFVAHPPYITEGTVAALVALLVGGQTLGPVLVLCLFRPAREVALAGLARPADTPGALLRLAAGAVVALSLQVAWAAVGWNPSEPWRLVEHLVYALVGGGQIGPMLWLAVAVGVAGPVAEEVLFRGLLFGLLRRRRRFWIAAIGSAAAFGLAHGPAAAIPAGLLGLYMAWQVERDGSLLGALALHMLNNLGALLALSALR